MGASLPVVESVLVVCDVARCPGKARVRIGERADIRDANAFARHVLREIGWNRAQHGTDTCPRHGVGDRVRIRMPVEFSVWR